MANFMTSAHTELQKVNNTYLNSRYAPTGNQTTGIPFMNYKTYGGRMTDWRPAGLQESTWKQQLNLPTNTNFFRTAITSDAINLGNTQNEAWVARTQTLGNLGSTFACNSTADCGAWDGTTCNKNYENWSRAHGNQSGSYCSQTMYPELKLEDGEAASSHGGGVYDRKLTNQGGIGRGCSTDKDCGNGYSCNNSYDIQGANLQQTGYCAMSYKCPDGTSHFLGTPYNSGIPQVPSSEQNENGKGYNTLEACKSQASAKQDCVKGSSQRWYAVYPGYCGVPTNLRQNNKSYGNVSTSSPSTVNKGFKIPAYATNHSSSIGSKVQSFTTWNNPGSLQTGSSEALKYSVSINPMPTNLY